MLETLSQYPNAGRQREAQFIYSRQGLPLTEARAGQSARCKRSELTGEEVRYLWDGDQIAEVRHFKQGQLQARRHWVWRGWELLVQQRQQMPAQPALQACASTAYIEQGLQAATENWESDFAVSQQNGELLGLYNPQGELRPKPVCGDNS